MITIVVLKVCFFSFSLSLSLSLAISVGGGLVSEFLVARSRRRQEVVMSLVFEVRRRVSVETVETVKTFLTQNIKISPDKSTYAPGRERGWLVCEAPLALGPAKRSGGFVYRPIPQRLWDWCCQCWSDAGMPGYPNLGLATVGGQKSIGIDFHKDAGYAAPNSLLINLGTIEWAISPNPKSYDRPDFHPLDSGEIAVFDAKLFHSAPNPPADRWGIVLWNISPRFRKMYEQYLAGQQQVFPHFDRQQRRYIDVPLPIGGTGGVK